MSSSIVVLLAASDPMKLLNGFLLVFLPHVTPGSKKGRKISSWERKHIKLSFHAFKVACYSCSDKVHCICAVAAIFQIQHQIFCYLSIAVATIEADEAIASSDFLKIMGISSQKGANRGDSGQL